MYMGSLFDQIQVHKYLYLYEMYGREPSDANPFQTSMHIIHKIHRPTYSLLRFAAIKTYDQRLAINAHIDLPTYTIITYCL